MATTASTSQLPIRYRVAAAAITVVVQALIFFPLFRQGGETSGQHANYDNSSGDENSRIEVVFLPSERKAAPTVSSAANKATKPFALLEKSFVQQRARTDNDASTSTAAANTNRGTFSTQFRVTSAGASAGAKQASQDIRNDGYMSAVREAIMREWQSSGSGEALAGCNIAIDQVSGGKAVRAWTVNCSGLSMHQRIRLETAAMRAQLPYAGFESVFQSHLELTF